jgi:protein-tyrosine phosphatase
MSDPEFRLLVVCTANRCRSPLAEAIARDRFATRRWRRSAAISSGTRAEDGLPATEGTELTAERLGLDVNAHSSRALTDDVIGWANLVLCMERRQALHVSSHFPGSFDITFPLRDFARRATAAPRKRGECAGHWVARLSTARAPGDLLGNDHRDDIADPAGKSLRRYWRAANEIEALIDEVIAAADGG